MATFLYWAWRDNSNKEEPYRHIYARRYLVEMCSLDGFKKKEEQGKGKIVELEIVEIKE